jgi:hypothetical protein
MIRITIPNADLASNYELEMGELSKSEHFRDRMDFFEGDRNYTIRYPTYVQIEKVNAIRPIEFF